MRLLIGIDDTDNKESRGTGYNARQLGKLIHDQNLGQVCGITRHQLYIHDDIAYTSQNSSACLDIETNNRNQVINICESFVYQTAASGSDAGLCIVEWNRINDTAIAWGSRAKCEVLKLHEALQIARNNHYYLQGFSGTKIGQIGALAAIGLRKSGNDGRFIWLGGVLELRNFDQGVYTPDELMKNAGIDYVQGINGELIPGHARIHCDGWTRPVLNNNNSVLYVEKVNQTDYDWKTVGKDHIRSIS